jgi:nucleoside-diphosphate-sugar epimerase
MRTVLAGGPQEAMRACARAFRAQDCEVTMLVDPAAPHGFGGLGAEVLPASVYDLARLDACLCKKDVAIFLGTDIPMTLLPGQADLGPFDRFRREGTRSYLAAVLRQRVPLLVLVSSVAVYGDCGEDEVDERSPLRPPPPAQSFADMEEILTHGREFQGLNHIILRAGLMYSARAWHTRNLLGVLQGGTAPPLAGERGYVSLVHTEDLAAAIVRAVEAAPAGEVLNIVDDVPVRLGALVTAAARALGVKPPGALPSFLLRLCLGREVARLLGTSCRASNARAKRRLGWTPRYPSIIERLPAEIAAWRETTGSTKPSPPEPGR